jgi:hypothetical protein
MVIAESRMDSRHAHLDALLDPQKAPHQPLRS